MALGTPYVCGGPVSIASDSTLVIPITADVPRSTTADGATLVLVFVQLDNDSSSLLDSVTDDSPIDTEDGYALCIFEDGFNHYLPRADPSAIPTIGLIVDPLLAGVNNIYLQLDSATAFVEAVAIAITGVGTSGGASWPSSPLDPGMTWIPAAVTAGAEAPLGGGGGAGKGAAWTYTTLNTVNMLAPAGTGGTDQNWDWTEGELAFYFARQNTKITDPGAWTWGDGSIADLVQWQSATGLIGPRAWMWEAIGYGPITPFAPGASVAGALADASSLFGGSGNTFGFLGGPGPVCSIPPPTGSPCFNHRLSVGPNAGASGAMLGNPAFAHRFPAGDDVGDTGAVQVVPAFAHRFRLGP